jgi:hypothetical protein
MATEQSPPPPLDPALILRARTALHAAGLPGDAVGDEEVAGLVYDVGLIVEGMSQWTWMSLERWWQDRLNKQDSSST